MTATNSTNAFTGDGTTKNFEIGFEFISENDVRVTVGDVLKVRGTDYVMQDPSAGMGKNALIAFASAPANASAIKFYRNTPIAVPAKNPTMSHLGERVALYRMQEREETTRRIDYTINATDLAAGTAQVIIAPCDGYIEANEVMVTEAVGTGGDITVEVAGTAVTGLTCTLANSAAIGKVVSDVPTTPHDATTQVKRGQKITVTPAAAFATTGAVKGYLTFQPADLG